MLEMLSIPNLSLKQKNLYSTQPYSNMYAIVYSFLSVSDRRLERNNFKKIRENKCGNKIRALSKYSDKNIYHRQLEIRKKNGYQFLTYKISHSKYF